MHHSTRLLRLLVSLTLFAAAGFARADETLILSGGSAPAGGTVSLPLMAFSSNGAPTDGTQTAALQWNIQYSTSDFTGISVVAGPSAQAAGKQIDCAGVPGNAICILFGMNQTAIPSGGVIGTILLSLNPQSKATNSVIQITRTLGATAAGLASPATGGSSTVTINQPLPPPTFQMSNVLNGASFVAQALSPGEIVTIFGSGLGPVSGSSLQVGSNGRVTTSLGGTQVFFDGVPAPLLFVRNDQINAVVPYEVAGKKSTQLQVSCPLGVSPVIQLPIGASAPGIFTYNASGGGQGLIVNQNGTLNSVSNPATRGSYVTMYVTGEGQTNPAGVDGKPALDFKNLPKPLLAVTAKIGGLPAAVAYAGAAPDFVAGLMQLNLVIPQNAVPGAALPLVVTVGGVPSPAGVTIAVK